MIYTKWKKPQDIQRGGGLKIAGIYLGSFALLGLLGFLIYLITEATDNIFLGAGVAILVLLIITFVVYKAALKKYSKGFMDV